jgi:hypothetical protein
VTDEVAVQRRTTAARRDAGKLGLHRERPQEEPMDDQPTLTDEDIRTTWPGGRPVTADTDDGDDADSTDADGDDADSTDGDAGDADSTDSADGDATDSADGDAGDADGQDA